MQGWLGKNLFNDTITLISKMAIKYEIVVVEMKGHDVSTLHKSRLKFLANPYCMWDKLVFNNLISFVSTSMHRLVQKCI
jgi:hypothetical protein